MSENGTPASPHELHNHTMVGSVSSRTGRAMLLEFVFGKEVRTVGIPARFLVSNSDAAVAAARLGLGLIQTPRRRQQAGLNAGMLIEVFAHYPPTPLSLLYPGDRRLAPRVRVFIDWLSPTLRPA